MKVKQPEGSQWSSIFSPLTHGQFFSSHFYWVLQKYLEITFGIN